VVPPPVRTEAVDDAVPPQLPAAEDAVGMTGNGDLVSLRAALPADGDEDADEAVREAIVRLMTKALREDSAWSPDHAHLVGRMGWGRGLVDSCWDAARELVAADGEALVDESPTGDDEDDRTDDQTEARTDRPSREAVVDEFVDELRMDPAWRPDYAALQARTGYRRSWLVLWPVWFAGSFRLWW
jgi:hypothetical protein